MKMEKSHREKQLDIGQKILDAMRTINLDDIAVDFYIDLEQYEVELPSSITIVDEQLNRVFIYVSDDTDVNQIVQDLATKNYRELEKKYSHTWHW